MQQPVLSHEALIPPQPLPAGADAFTRRMHDLLDGHPKDDATVTHAFAGMDQMFDHIAAGLYSLASMLVGEGESAVRLVETAVANAEVSACENAREARESSRIALCAAAIEILRDLSPGSLDAPQGFEPANSCIDDNDLDAAGEYGEELERMLAGPDRDRVRAWLESMSPSLRTVFVLRAVAGLSARQVASLLASHGGGGASLWTSHAVSEFFRQGLCSLASQLLHAATPRV